MNKKILGGIIRVAISFTMIGLLLFMMRSRLTDVFRLLLDVDIPLLALAVLFSYVAHFLFSARLRTFLTAQGIAVSAKEGFGLTLIGYFFNNFLPTAVGGDVAKAYYASKKTEGKLHSFTAVFMDRLIGSLTLIFLALSGFIFLSGDIGAEFVVWPVWALFCLGVLFLFLIFNPKMITKISALRFFRWTEKMHSSVTAFKDKKRLFPRAIAVSIAAQLALFANVYLLIGGLGSFVPYAKVLFLMPIVGIASMIPSINGLGVREGAFLILFRPFIGADKAFALGVLWFFIYLTASISGGFIYAFARHGKKGVS